MKGDPESKYYWRDHDMMREELMILVKDWSRIIEEENGEWWYQTDRRLQKTIGDKIFHPAKVCQARIMDVVDQAKTERMKKIL